MVVITAVAVTTIVAGTTAVAVTTLAVVDNVATEVAVGIPALAHAVITIFFGLRRQ